MTKIDELGKDLREAYPDMWLGSLVWYYVPSDAAILTKDWIAAVESAGVGEMVPTKQRAVDAFKRAVNSVGQSGGKVTLNVNGTDMQFRFLTRDTGQDDTHVFRDLVVERLGKHKLSYGPVVKFVFDRGAKTMTAEIDETIFDSMPDEVQDEVTLRQEGALKQYQIERFVLSPNKVRDLLRDEITNEQHGIPCKPGSGIYFVFDRHQDRVDGVAAVIEHLSRYGLTFHQMPVADVAGQREMIVRAFENETIGEVDKLMHDMTEVLRGNKGKITQKVAIRYAQDYSRLSNRLAEYSDLLEQKFEEQGTRLDVMKAQVTKLIESIDAD